VVSAENLGGLAGTLAPLGYSFAVIDDAAQKVHVNNLDAHRKVSNVLFSPMPLRELRDFCLSVRPL
jgi:hypothetical protein